MIRELALVRSLIPMTHTPETGTRKLVPFSDTVYSVPDETKSRISGLIFLYYCPPQFILKQYNNKQHNLYKQTTQLAIV